LEFAASGRQVLPIPEQLQGDPGLLSLVIDFLKHHRRPWRHSPKVCDYASIIKARSRTMDELQAFAKTLNITGDPTMSGHVSIRQRHVTMEATENRARSDLAVVWQGISLVTLQR
jgi:hypothetical protein